jgi:membrane protease YdiL (CAAX protease family)
MWRHDPVELGAPALTAWRRTLREQGGYALLDLSIVALIFLLDWRHLIYLSKTPYLLALGWLSLRLRGLNWRAVGFAQPASWLRVLWLGLAAGLAIEALELFVTQPLLVWWTGKYPDLALFARVRHDVNWLLLLLAGSWTLAAFGEELVWRGYIFNRVTDLVGGRPAGIGAALFLTSAAFGLAHADQGLTGIIENTIDGALLGLLYLASGRNLWLPIVAHGVTDTADSVLLFLGWYPGT